MGLPVLRLSSSSTHAVTNTPAEPQAAFRSHSPVTTAFPVLTPGRLPHHPFRGLLSVHSHYGLHGRQVPYKTLYTRGFSRFVTSTAAPVATGRSESCRTGFAPAERQRLCTAHVKNRLMLQFPHTPPSLSSAPQKIADLPSSVYQLSIVALYQFTSVADSWRRISWRRFWRASSLRA